MGASANRSPAFFIVLDTQIWVYHTSLLRSPLGESLLHLLRIGSGSIGLPEVVRSEIIKHARKRALDARKQIENNIHQLQLLLGRDLALPLPATDDLEKCAHCRLDELAPLLTPLATTMDHYQGALARVMNETPPNNEKNQQYKDSLIWESVMELSQRGPVYLVTYDGKFFGGEKDGDRKRLADPLAAEIQQSGNCVKVYNDLAHLLDDLKAVAPEKVVASEFDIMQLVPAIGVATAFVFDEYAKKYQLQLGTIESAMDRHHLIAFSTNSPNQVSIKFELARPASAVAIDDRPEVSGYVVLLGTCFRDTVTNQLRDVTPELVQFVDSAGKRIDGYGRVLYAYPSNTL